MKASVRWSFTGRIYERAFRRVDPDFFSAGVVWSDFIEHESRQAEPVKRVTRTPRLRLIKRDISEPVRVFRYHSRQIAFEMGFTRQRLHALEARAIEKLRHPSRALLLKPFLERAA